MRKDASESARNKHRENHRKAALNAMCAIPAHGTDQLPRKRENPPKVVMNERRPKCIRNVAIHTAEDPMIRSARPRPATHRDCVL